MLFVYYRVHAIVVTMIGIGYLVQVVAWVRTYVTGFICMCQMFVCDNSRVFRDFMWFIARAIGFMVLS